MADQIEELIREIAAKHGIAVSRDDPILVLQTINNRLMLDSSNAQQALLDHYKEELEALSMRWRMDAKDKAERVLNAALSASKEAMFSMIEESAKVQFGALQAEIDIALSKVTSSFRETNRAAQLNLAASCVTMLAAVTVVWAMFH